MSLIMRCITSATHFSEFVNPKEIKAVHVHAIAKHKIIFSIYCTSGHKQCLIVCDLN